MRRPSRSRVRWASRRATASTRALHGFAAALTDPQLARIQQDADVAFASEDRQVQATDAPLAPGETAPTGIRRVNAATTTTTQGTAASVNVAVIDTGIGLSNTDLNVQPGTNCVSPGSAPEDDNGHGTHVSGTIAAKNTGSRVVGVAPDTQLWAVKVLNGQGNGTWSQVICGIDWVTAHASVLNIHVASMSLSGSGTNDSNCGRTNRDALHLAICNSTAAGVTYVVAAGNNGANFSTFVPAAYPEAVTVTAVSDWDGLPGGTAGSPRASTRSSSPTTLTRASRTLRARPTPPRWRTPSPRRASASSPTGYRMGRRRSRGRAWPRHM